MKIKNLTLWFFCGWCHFRLIFQGFFEIIQYIFNKLISASQLLPVILEKIKFQNQYENLLEFWLNIFTKIHDVINQLDFINLYNAILLHSLFTRSFSFDSCFFFFFFIFIRTQQKQQQNQGCFVWFYSINSFNCLRRQIPKICDIMQIPYKFEKMFTFCQFNI